MSPDAEAEEAWWCVKCERPLHLGDDPDGVPGRIDRDGESQCNGYPHFDIPIEWKEHWPEGFIDPVTGRPFSHSLKRAERL